MAASRQELKSPQPSLSAGLSARGLAGTILGLQLVLLMASLDQTIVGTAMPHIIAELNGFSRYGWVTTAYLLSSTAAVPIFGKLSDIYGRKRLYLAGAALFVLSSALCGAAGLIPGLGDGMAQLIAFRGLQGLGGGIVMTITFVVIGDLFPPRERGKYQGLFVAVQGVAAVVGPTLGGWITDHFSWRWVFYVNMPVGLLALVVLFFAFPDVRPKSTGRAIDWLGVILLLACLVPLLLALTWVSTEGWHAPRVIIGLIVSAVMLAEFIIAERRAADPLLPLSLLKLPVVSISLFSLFTLGLSLFGVTLFLPLFMQGVVGVSATRSGSLLTPMMLMMVTGSLAGGQLLTRTGRYKIMALTGLATMAAGMTLLSRLGLHATQAQTVLAMLLLGLGLGLVQPVYTVVVQNSAAPEMLGAATAAAQFSRAIGGTLGAAIFSSIMLGRYARHLSESLPAGTTPFVAHALRDPLRLAQAHPALVAAMGPSPEGRALLSTLLGFARSSLVYALDDVFLIAALLIGAALLSNFFLPEVTLRRTNAAAPASAVASAVPVTPAHSPDMEAMPTSAAVSPVVREPGRESRLAKIFRR